MRDLVTCSCRSRFVASPVLYADGGGKADGWNEVCAGGGGHLSRLEEENPGSGQRVLGRLDGLDRACLLVVYLLWGFVLIGLIFSRLGRTVVLVGRG